MAAEDNLSGNSTLAINFPSNILLDENTTGFTALNDSKWVLISTLIILYLGLVQILRYQNLRMINSTYAAYVEDPYSMDYKTAHKIMRKVMLIEGPTLFYFSSQLGLLKTYTSQSGTQTLVATRELSVDARVGRRAEDTMTLLMEYIVGDVDSERGMKAMGKTNWLHRRYGNLIRNPELKHVMSMFVLEPIRWFDMYEWRPMTRLEKISIYVYWKELAARLGIDDVPETLEEFQQWQKEYLSEHMFPCPSNKAVAEGTLGLLVRNVPSFLKGFVRSAILSVMEDDVRVAMGVETPPVWISRVTHAALRTRQFAVRHLCLPRFYEIDVLPTVDKMGNIHRSLWAFEPWGIHASKWGTLKAWLFNGGRLVPGISWKSDGLAIEDVGPAKFEGVAGKAVFEEMEKLQEYANTGGLAVHGCPFKF